MCKWEIQQYSLLRASHCLLKVVGKQVSTTTERWSETRQPVPVVVRVISTWDSSWAFSQLSTMLAKEFHLANEMLCIKCKLHHRHQPLKAPRGYTRGPKKPCPSLSWWIYLILSWFEHCSFGFLLNCSEFRSVSGRAGSVTTWMWVGWEAALAGFSAKRMTPCS